MERYPLSFTCLAALFGVELLGFLPQQTRRQYWFLKGIIERPNHQDDDSLWRLVHRKIVHIVSGVTLLTFDAEKLTDSPSCAFIVVAASCAMLAFRASRAKTHANGNGKMGGKPRKDKMHEGRLDAGILGFAIAVSCIAILHHWFLAAINYTTIAPAFFADPSAAVVGLIYKKLRDRQRRIQVSAEAHSRDKTWAGSFVFFIITVLTALGTRVGHDKSAASFTFRTLTFAAGLTCLERSWTRTADNLPIALACVLFHVVNSLYLTNPLIRLTTHATAQISGLAFLARVYSRVERRLCQQRLINE